MIQQRAFSVCNFITELSRVDIATRADKLDVLVYVTGFERLVFSLLNLYMAESSMSSINSCVERRAVE